MYKVYAQRWHSTSHKACSNRCHQFSHSIGMATGRFTRFFPIVVNTQHHCEFCELGFEKKCNLGIWDSKRLILYQAYLKKKGKWVARWNLALGSLISQYSNKLTPFSNKSSSMHREKDNSPTSRAIPWQKAPLLLSICLYAIKTTGQVSSFPNS